MLEFRNVTFQYDVEDFNIIDDLSFTVEPEEFISIIGISGFIKLEDSLSGDYMYYPYITDSYQNDIDYYKEYLTQLETDIRSSIPQTASSRVEIRP